VNSTGVQIERPIPMLDLGAQYQSIAGEIKDAIDRVLISQHFILGPEVKALEGEVARYCGRTFGVGVASGTDALILALAASGVGPGDEVVVPAFTFIATADAVSLLGATPVFVDIDPATFCIDPGKVVEKITSRTRAILPVHLYGQSADMSPILEVASSHRISVIEDNAQAIGATYKGRKTASMGEIGCLSFFPSKNLGAYGDAGMIVTDSEDVASDLRSLRAHGAIRKYFSVKQGWNSRLDEMQAAILRVKLRCLDAWSNARRSRAAYYSHLLRNVPGVSCPVTQPGNEHVYHQYTIRVKNRDVIQKALADAGISSTVYYPVPIHLQPIYQSLGYKEGDLPHSELAAQEVLSLPIYPELSNEQIRFIVEVLSDALSL
jgi:dTDP-4-amino-4,6-dideoxygalactose transaminase